MLSCNSGNDANKVLYMAECREVKAVSGKNEKGIRAS
jgi:hypothetical protein